ARQQIAAEETTFSHQGSLSSDLEAELTRTRTRLAGLNARLAALAETAARAGEELRGADAQAQGQREQADGLEAALQGTARRLAELHEQVKADKTAHVEEMRQAARLQNDVVGYKAQVENLRRERDRLRHRTEQAAESLASLDLELQELTRADEDLQRRLAAARQALADQRQQPHPPPPPSHHPRPAPPPL